MLSRRVHCNGIGVRGVSLHDQRGHARLGRAIRLGHKFQLVDVTLVCADDEVVAAREAVKRLARRRMARARAAGGRRLRSDPGVAR